MLEAPHSETMINSFVLKQNSMDTNSISTYLKKNNNSIFMTDNQKAAVQLPHRKGSNQSIKHPKDFLKLFASVNM